MFYQSNFENMVSTDPGNVTFVDVRPYDKSAYVSWSTESQEECSGAVINYTVLCSIEGSPVLSKSYTDLYEICTWVEEIFFL